MKQTAIYDFHKELGARMVPFAGYSMPLQYTGIKQEHMAVRNRVGVFDVSHMGEFWAKGPKAFELVQRLTTNDVNNLHDGKVHYSCFTDKKGGIIDDILVYRIDAETYLMVVNAANMEKDWAWCVQMAEALGMKVGKELYNASDEICQLAIQGPLALLLMQKIVDEPIHEMKSYTFKKINIAGIKNAILSVTGYTGSGGYEVYVANEDGKKLWNAVMDVGEEYGIQACGLAARDTLRMEMGYCLHGNDIDEEHTPFEAGLNWVVKLTDGNDFPGRPVLEQQKRTTPEKKLRGFIMLDKGIPRKGYAIENAEGVQIGEVTSGTMAPAVKQAIGMGYIAKEYNAFESEIFIRIRKKILKAKIVKMPFYNR